MTGINNLGQAVGFSNAADGRTYAVTWKDGQISTLPLAPGATYSTAHGINDLGQIVGNVGTGALSYHAALWTTEGITELTLEPFTTAYAINNAGQITGGGGELGGFLWEDGTLTDLSSAMLAALGLNSQGTVVGFDLTPVGNSTISHAILVQNGEATNLGTAPGGPNGFPTAINDQGQIVGTGDLNGYYAFLWDGQMTSLQSLLPADSPWNLWSMWDINNHGQIVGVAWMEGSYHLVMLVVPEPSTLLMTLSFGALLLSRRCATRWRMSNRCQARGGQSSRAKYRRWGWRRYSQL